jgi:5-(carboxyamino)imidazole ribonucleotide mutase
MSATATGSPRPLVLLLAGSPSDIDLVLSCQETLEDLGIPSAIRILSAHRTPDETAACVRDAEANGFQAIVAFAGMSAHLAGVSAAHTLLPVIGVPCAVGPIGGIDALLASAQMPPGTPVATVAIDGAKNGALLAARILGVAHPEIRERLAESLTRDRARYEPSKIEAEVERKRKARRASKSA